uniref:Thiamine-phosphate pyrophosphorylase n=1 Tax=Lotharella oceanica TaxID=641309 RepID=A0A7S2U0B4_9EUKA|mmetsp:Transcript_3659/g.7075  ORF Transcript_3659/g.7075 Transcript_3659/m.7075 type:complete len:453 (+) Transcript_3659:3-1361(+)
MLGTADVVTTVVEEIRDIFAEAKRTNKKAPFIVCDPVMVATTGAELMERGTQDVMVRDLFPLCDIVTPNLKEAEKLAGFPIKSPKDVARAAAVIRETGKCKNVLIKGGHSNSAYMQDYLLQDDGEVTWLTTPKVDTANTHGTGCTLSSALAAVSAGGTGTTPGHSLNRNANPNLASHVVLAKAYVHQGIRAGAQIGKGPGPVGQTYWPQEHQSFPWATPTAHEGAEGRYGPFPEVGSPGIQLLPVVPNAEWVDKLGKIITEEKMTSAVHVQIRPKGLTREQLEMEIKKACDLSRKHGIKLWVNDHWDLAIKHKAFGLHVGQEDLFKVDGKGCQTEVDLQEVHKAGLRLGVSTHNYHELAKGLAIRPSYVSLGPIYPTQSKAVKYHPQTLEGIKCWRSLTPPSMPLVAIGGISMEDAEDIIRNGAEGIAVIGAVVGAKDVGAALRAWDKKWLK